MWTVAGEFTLLNSVRIRVHKRTRAVREGLKGGPARNSSARVAPAVLLAFVIGAVAPVGLQAASRRQRADKAYHRALAARSKLEARRAGSRSLREYDRVANEFYLVYRTDPGYPNAPRALSAEAFLLDEVGHAFGSEHYFRRAVEAFQFLAAQYPEATVSREGLIKAADILRVDLAEPEEAAEAYDVFLRRYRSASEAPEARRRLAELKARVEGARAAEEPPTPPEAVAPPGITPESGTLTEASSGRLLQVNDVRYWEGPNDTRVVISLEAQTTYHSVRLQHPDRLVFDIVSSRLSQVLACKTFPVENSFLHDIRVAQYQPDVTRVVLDLTKIEDYTVFTLPNPFRIIIDVHGAHYPVMAETAEPASVGVPPASPVDVAAASFAPGSSAPSDTASERGSETDLASSGRPKASPPADADDGSATDASASSASAASAPVPASAIHAPAPMADGTTTLTRALGLKVARIVIDPGHGGHDTGTIGPDGVEEKNVALDVALRLRRLIQQRLGAQVVMTRTDDTFIPLEERTAIANQSAADLFVSIHCNASRDPSARGIEVYYLNFTTDPDSLEVAARENATSQESVHQLQSLIKKIALNEKIDESSELAQFVDTSLEQATARSGNHQPDRGLKKAPFVVLIGAHMPSILAEISFLTNPHDEHLLSTASYRQQIAEGVYRGIARYVGDLGTSKLADRGAVIPPARRAARSAAADPPAFEAPRKF
jgi:N-acetylmuramoyl-L-alanine amidase